MIVAVGDTHGQFEKLTDFIIDKHPEIILQCGDFGYWPSFFNVKSMIVNGKTKIYFCDGNHEDHSFLSKKKKRYEIKSNVFYQPRGTTLQLPDGRNVLFVGGASSIDRQFRIPGYDWFPEELLTEKVFEFLPKEKVDIVISHTSPTCFGDLYIDDDHYKDLSRIVLQEVYEMYKPTVWIHGHFHEYATGQFEDCKWTSLDHISSKKGIWWTEI
jgi:Icc-related predicted phosphoesterase